MREELREKIPENIEIGPFFVDVTQLKSQLIAKHDEIINALKQKLLNNVNQKLLSIQSRYDFIQNKISERSPTIEHLQEITNFIPSIQGEINKLGKEMKSVLSDFYVIDSFLIIQPDTLFSLKWRSLQMPQIISNSVNEILAQQAQEIERFWKMQVSDETVFMERLQIVMEEVNASMKKYSFDDVKIAQSVFDKTWKLLTETRERGELLNRRLRILNQYKPPTSIDDDDDEQEEEATVDKEIDMTQLNVEVECLYPFYNSWTMTLNFLSSKEVWTQMPFSELSIDGMSGEMKRYEKEIISLTHEFFTNENDFKALQTSFQEMMKCIDIVSDLMNFKQEHWQRLNAKFNTSSLNYSTSTISDLMMRGIPSVIGDIVKELFLEAKRDATREHEEKVLAEKEEMERQRREEELLKQKQMRRAKRPDLFN